MISMKKIYFDDDENIIKNFMSEKKLILEFTRVATTSMRFNKDFFGVSHSLWKTKASGKRARYPF